MNPIPEAVIAAAMTEDPVRVEVRPWQVVEAITQAMLIAEHSGLSFYEFKIPRGAEIVAMADGGTPAWRLHIEGAESLA